MTVIIFIGMLVVLIVGHEFGHLVVAKLSGMKVPEFGIGFPPKVAGIKIGDTEYTLNALPFGGFVKIVGEDVAEAADDPAAFSNRPKLLQAATLVAGPFSNVILAFLFFTLSFMVGITTAADGAHGHTLTDSRVVVTDVVAKSPAAKSGIIAGDTIVSILVNGGEAKITKPEQIGPLVADADGPVTLTVERDHRTFSFSMTPESNVVPDEPARHAIGIASSLVGTLKLSITEAFTAGFLETVQKTKDIAKGFASLLVSAIKFSPEVANVAGPVGIATLTGEAARFGVGSLLAFAAMISLNLGILNLLPFPALDGGRLLFVGIETATRRPIPPKIANTLNYIGFAILILLMLAITAHDITKLVT